MVCGVILVFGLVGCGVLVMVCCGLVGVVFGVGVVLKLKLFMIWLVGVLLLVLV